MRSTALALVRYAVSLTLLVGVWWIVTAVADVPKYILPSPAAVVGVIGREHEAILAATMYTTRNALLGATLGVVLGLVTGGVLAYFGRARWLTEPYLVIFQSFPREALAPLFIVWLGFGVTPKVALAALLCYFPMALVTLNSLTQVRSDYIELIRSWGANKPREFWKCRFPASIPALIGLQRVCLPLALVGSVLGEFMGGSRGLGYTIMSSGAVSQLDRVFAAVVVLGVVGSLFLGGVNVLQGLLSKYEKE